MRHIRRIVLIALGLETMPFACLVQLEARREIESLQLAVTLGPGSRYVAETRSASRRGSIAMIDLP